MEEGHWPFLPGQAEVITKARAALARWRDDLAERAVLSMPACRSTRDGMIDGRDGLLPKSTNPYYLEGHRLGTSWRTKG